MAYDCKMVLDSVAPHGKRLSTMTVTYPRFIHAEVLTHRDRARNSASSRAIPWPVMSEMIMNDPVIPIRWGMEKGGMQTGDAIPDHLAEHATKLWLQGRNYMVALADRIYNIERDYLEEHNGYAYKKGDDEHLIQVHKSLPNRLTEPWMWITVIMTATEWNNFFRLRCHPDAEIHFQKIAGMIRNLLAESKPQPIAYGEWHTPYVTNEEKDSDPFVKEHANDVSVARCARVSYLTHEGKREPEKDLKLFNRLCNGSGFGHWSPHEHVAMAVESAKVRSGPYYGYIQYRKRFANECAPG